MSLIKKKSKDSNYVALEQRVRELEKIVKELQVLVKGKKRGPKPKVDSLVSNITKVGDAFKLFTKQGEYTISLSLEKMDEMIAHLEDNKQYELKDGYTLV